MNKPIKVIHMAPLGTGGITKLTVTINQNIDLDKVQFDYLVFRNRKEFMEDEILKLGAIKQVVDLEKIRNPLFRFLKKMKGMKELFKREQYDVVHVDASTPYDVIVAVAARLAKVKVIIMHSHNDSYKKGNKLKEMLMPFFKMVMHIVCTDYIAISEPAAKFMFPRRVLEKKQYRITKNAINAEEYAFDKDKRRKIRSKLGIDNTAFVLGNVGRFVYQKNHDYMIQVFNQLYKKHKESRLLLIGEGSLQNKICDKVNELGISEGVIFYGITHDIPSVLQAMDAFIFPSRFEGLGIVAIEAQAAGLPVWCANTIPEEAKVCDDFHYIAGWDPVFWAESIWKGRDDAQRHSNVEKVKAAGYDINVMTKQMQDFYQERVLGIANYQSK